MSNLMKRLLKPIIIIRFVLGFGFAVLGFFVSKGIVLALTPKILPTYGQAFAAGVLGTVAALFFPWIGLGIGRWFEKVVARTISRIVSDFWAQQSRRIQEARRVKQEQKAKKAKEEKQKKEAILHTIVDTSSLIDGRIFDVARAGFLDGKLVVPQFVLDELQTLADSSNDLKRERGRRGLSLLDEAKKDKRMVISVKPWKKDSKVPVDKELLKMAKIMRGKIATVDYNLNKVASVSGVAILNVNELANAIRAVVLPGECLKIKVVQVGKDHTQGVGYLQDGTMVVVEGGKELIGQEVEVAVTRILQTVAGKMVFAQKNLRC